MRCRFRKRGAESLSNSGAKRTSVRARQRERSASPSPSPSLRRERGRGLGPGADQKVPAFGDAFVICPRPARARNRRFGRLSTPRAHTKRHTNPRCYGKGGGGLGFLSAPGGPGRSSGWTCRKGSASSSRPRLRRQPPLSQQAETERRERQGKEERRRDRETERQRRGREKTTRTHEPRTPPLLAV